MQLLLHLIFVALAGACFSGCCTQKSPVEAGPPGTSIRGKISQEQVKRFQSAAAEVFRNHGFIEVPRAVVGADSIVWLVTARTRSPGELTMATVTMSPERQITVELTAYQRIGADWAMLGRFFRGPIDQETQAMQKELEKRLSVHGVTSEWQLVKS